MTYRDPGTISHYADFATAIRPVCGQMIASSTSAYPPFGLAAASGVYAAPSHCFATTPVFMADRAEEDALVDVYMNAVEG